MSSENLHSAADFFLRDIPNVKIQGSNASVVKSKKSIVKEELQIINLNPKVQEDVMEVLRYIHGDEFSLSTAENYEDKQSNFTKKYWTERGNLVVKGGFDYSQVKNEDEDDVGRLRMFALLRLESYGFHKEHCLEAFEYTNGDIESALCLLYLKYFKSHNFDGVEHGLTKVELLELRLDEKSALESIYNGMFYEKVQNTVWILTLKLDYLINIFHKRDCTRNVTADAKAKKRPMCKGFLRGYCKYGSNCRFSHSSEIVDNNESHFNNYQFELEIRFPLNTQYPYEPPLIFLKTNAVIPALTILHICKRLYSEAEILAQSGIPSVYTITELLQNEQDIVEHLKKGVNFLNNYEKLFPSEIKSIAHIKKSTHYKKGSTNRDYRKELSMQDLLSEDSRITEKYLLKTKDKKYLSMLRNRKNLPAWSMMKDILNTIQSSQVTIISGETGCGKSTQVPQFILDDWLLNFNDKKNHVEIVCTQPRRISAIGVAERISDERIERIGNVIGYQIRLENKISLSTRLTFCTTRILLRRLESDPYLSKISHIIVDEVHERSEESDFLLLILKDLMHLRPDLKIILMSATLNATIFSNYFGGVPILDIPGRTFPVEQYFLEDILEITDYVLEENSQYSKYIKKSEDIEEQLKASDVVLENVIPNKNIRDENLTFVQTVARYKDYSKKTCKNLYFTDPDKINFELIEATLMWIVEGDHSYPKEGSILIFLPGIAEITFLYDQLKGHSEFGLKLAKYILLPLHSSLTGEEQAAVFRKPKNGARKIIISTNIAETSVTIDDCVYVIDAGKMKEKQFDSSRNMESLETVWVTRANALQRKGRAGRVMPGVCFHLYTNHRFKHGLLDQPVPAVHRIPLEQLLLDIKVLPNFDGKDIHRVLDGIIEPPVKENVESSIKRLQYVGAFDKDENLTPLGHHLAALPVDVRIGKLMLYGAIFGCVDSALTMAACLSYKSPFVTPFNKKEAANAKKRYLATGYSDHLTVLVAYKKWLVANAKSYQAGLNFANENYLSHKTLQTIVEVKYQLLELLVSIDFVPINLQSNTCKNGRDEILKLTGQEFNKNGENKRLLSAILCAALYPNIIKVLTPGKSFQESAFGAVPKQPDAKDLKFRTKLDWVFLHPSSVNSIVRSFPSPYLVYQEIVKTSKIFIRDCTMVPAIPLVLFSGFDIDISVHNGCTFIVLADGWINFKVHEHKVAEIVKMLRAELQDLLEEKIKDPLLNLLHHDKGEKIITTILNIVTSE